jgi:hypothetical protein
MGTISFGGGTVQYSSSNQIDYSSRLSDASGQAFNVDTNGQDITWATDLTNTSSSIAKLGAGTLIFSNSIGVGPINIVVSGGSLSLQGSEAQLAGIGSISLQGGILNCPNCPSLGDLEMDEDTELYLDGQNAIFNSLMLASNVTLSAASISVIGVSSLGGSIIATSGDISFGGAVTLVSETTITTTNRNVAFGSTIDGFSGLTIHSGSGVATFNGDIGSTAPIANLTVNALGGIFIKNKHQSNYKAPATF